VRVKMCGMTRSEDIHHAIRLGVDAIGLVFYSQSSRYIDIEQAKKLLKNVPPFIDAVAVLVNPNKAFVQQILNELPIQLLQFHGDETVEFCSQFDTPFIKAIQPENTAQIQSCAACFRQAQALLLDTPSYSSRGGTGITFDWQIIPHDLSKPYILAGGLNEFNIAAAVQSGTPYAVDVCSGIEVSPGVKDHLKMNRFIKVLWGI
jgi:phosphoribosylanthranilate isomerase